MIYWVFFGFVECFFVIFFEYYVGDFLLWFVLSQVVGVFVVEQYGDYFDDVIVQLCVVGV